MSYLIVMNDGAAGLTGSSWGNEYSALEAELEVLILHLVLFTRYTIAAIYSENNYNVIKIIFCICLRCENRQLIQYTLYIFNLIMSSSL